MRKNGFTFIELLSVIVILAIIALIATPIVLNIIKNAKESADERSVEHYIDAVENAIMQKSLKNEIVDDGVYSIEQLTQLGVKATGTLPSEGYIIIEKNKIKDIQDLKIGNSYLNYNADKQIISMKGRKSLVNLQDNSFPKYMEHTSLSNIPNGVRKKATRDTIGKSFFINYYYKTAVSDSDKYNMSLSVEPNKDYTISFDFINNINSKLSCYVIGVLPDGAYRIKSSISTNGRLVLTFNTGIHDKILFAIYPIAYNDESILKDQYVDILHFKLEKGSNATPYDAQGL